MIFDGKAFAKEREELLARTIAKRGLQPKMVSILVGDDEASKIYTRLKRMAAERVGIKFEIRRVEEKVKFEELLKVVREEGGKKEVSGLMVQLPLPGELDRLADLVTNQIPLNKDVDGLRYPKSKVLPATVRAIMNILETINDNGEIWKKKFVVVGYSGAVGKPLMEVLKQMGVDIAGVRSTTSDPQKIMQGADVLISVVGRAGLIGADDVKSGVVAVDVGISRDEDGQVRGDMDQEVYNKASVAVPVPGGVGPVTVVSLLENLVELIS